VILHSPLHRNFRKCFDINIFNSSLRLGLFDSNILITTLLGSLTSILIKKKSYPCTRPWRPIGLCDVEGPTVSRQSAHRWR
jgi:hypothetical protein